MNPTRIVVVNSKGGSGKSLIARELVHSMIRTGVPYNFYNFDGQLGSDEEHEDENAQVMIADTPARATDKEIRSYASSADVIVVPTMTGMDDAAPAVHTIAVAQATNPQAKIVVIQNSWSRYRLSKDYGDWLKNNLGEDIEIVRLPRSEMFGQARAAQKSVVDWAPKSKAAKMTLEMINSIRSAARMDKENR